MRSNTHSPRDFFRTPISLRGDSGWKPQRLALVSLLLPWLDVSSRGDPFIQTREFLASHKCWEQFPKMYSGYAKALKRDGDWLIETLRKTLRDQLPELTGSNFRRNGRVILAADGSRIERPRTPENERALGCAGREKTAPQVMVTALDRGDSGLPFDARVGSRITGEKTLLSQRLDDLPEGALLTTDAGFFCEELAQDLLDRGVDFLLRVGATSLSGPRR